MPGEAELRLRERLSKLKNTGLLRGARVSGELDKLQRQLDRIENEATDEEIWHSVELARHDERPYTLDYVERLFDDFFELHGDRFRADDPAIVAGLGEARRPHRRDRRAAEGTRHQGAHAPQLRHGVSRGLPEGDAHDAARRHVRLSADHVRRHAGRVPRGRGRAARPGRRDRALPGGDAPAPDPDRRLHHRRGRLRRGGRDRGRRQRADAGERDLLGDLARGLRRDPLARPGREAEGGRRLQARRGPLPRARRDRLDRARSRPEAPTPTTTRPPGCSASRSARPWTTSTAAPGTTSSAGGAPVSAASAFSLEETFSGAAFPSIHSVFPGPEYDSRPVKTGLERRTPRLRKSFCQWKPGRLQQVF